LIVICPNRNIARDGLIYNSNSNSASPYCGTVLFPSGYQGHGNCETVPGVTFNVELTYTGQTKPVDLPIYTGNNGISTGIQYPLGYSTSSSSSTPVGAIVGGVVGGVAVLSLIVLGVVLILCLRSKGRRNGRTAPVAQTTTPMPMYQNVLVPPTQKMQHQPTMELAEQPRYELEQPGTTKPY
jgi:hypothetical protein